MRPGNHELLCNAEKSERQKQGHCLEHNVGHSPQLSPVEKFQRSALHFGQM